MQKRLYPAGVGPLSKSHEYEVLLDHLTKLENAEDASCRRVALIGLQNLIVNSAIDEDAMLNAIVACLLQKIAIHPEEKIVFYKFLQKFIQSQYCYLGNIRVILFHKVICRGVSDSFEDNLVRFELLKTLISEGKDIEYLENDIGTASDLFSSFFHSIHQHPEIEVLLELVTTLLKHNAAYMQEMLIATLVNCCAALTTKLGCKNHVNGCIEFLKCVITYHYLPIEVLPVILESMCKLVNVQDHYHQSWRFISQLMSTHLSYQSIVQLCGLLEKRKYGLLLSEYPAICRGAVYFISMALWGTKKLEMKIHPTIVLPAFSKAIALSQSEMVAYEISLSILRLVDKASEQLSVSGWHSLLCLMQELVSYIDHKENCGVDLANKVEEILECLEEACSDAQCPDNQTLLLHIIQHSYGRRKVKSILYFLSHLDVVLSQNDSDTFIAKLLEVLQRFYIGEKRPEVKIKAVNCLKDVYVKHAGTLGGRIVDEVIDPSLHHLMPVLAEREVAPHVALLLLEIAALSGSGCSELVQVLGKMLDLHSNIASVIVEQLEKMIEQRRAVAIVVEPLLVMLLDVLMASYKKSSIFKDPKQRYTILRLVLKLRTNKKFQLGNANGKFWTKLFFKSLDNASSMPGITVVSYAPVMKMLADSVSEETDCDNLFLILHELVSIIHCRGLMMLAEESDVNLLINNLCSLKMQPPLGVSQSDFQSKIFPVISAAVSLSSILDKQNKSNLISCLGKGIISSCAIPCIRALNVAALEMPDQMQRSLPSILQQFCHIAENPATAIPLMEFLSSIVRVPVVYSQLTFSQYNTIFAITLPNTDPSRRSSYIVTLAYHVIALWFVKIKLQLRKQFVPIILKGLGKHVCEELRGSETSVLTSSRREKKNPKKEAALTESEESMWKDHKQLTETCVDMLSRFTYATVSSEPRRSCQASFLLLGSQSQSWVIGNKIITITTSGGGKTVDQVGLCSNCQAFISKMDAGVPEVIKSDYKSLMCNCWSSMWAEIKIHRPTSSFSWMMKMENQLETMHAFPLSEISALFNMLDLSECSSLNDSNRAIGKSSSSPDLAGNVIAVESDQPPSMRDRCHTVGGSDRPRTASSLISQSAELSNSMGTISESVTHWTPVSSSINPSFVFMQLFHHSLSCQQHQVSLIPNNAAMERSMMLLDRTVPYETHKIGVIYVRPGQSNKPTAILRNSHGSQRYQNFLGTLGSLVALADANDIYLGGLDRKEPTLDGTHTYFWQDELTRVVFHVATLIPTRDCDASCNQKILHIGNDYVTIVYNESGEAYQMDTIRGQFNYCSIVVEPLDHGHNAITTITKQNIHEIIGHTGTILISDKNLGMLTRQMAIHADFASTILSRENHPRDAFASNWLERLRIIERVKERIAEEKCKQQNFTDFT